MLANTAQARPPRPHLGVADNNKDLPPPPPPKSPRHNVFPHEIVEARQAQTYSSHNSPLLSVGPFHSPLLTELDGSAVRPMTQSPSPEPQQNKYIPYSGEIYELPATYEAPSTATTTATATVAASTPASISASTPVSVEITPISHAPTPDPITIASVSPVISTIPKRVPVRKPVPVSSTPVEENKTQPEPETALSTTAREEPSHIAPQETKKEVESSYAVRAKESRPMEKATSSDNNHKDLPPPLPAKDDHELGTGTQKTNESSLLKRRNPSVRLSSLELAQPATQHDDDKLEVLSSAIYTPPARTPRSANKSRATTPLPESGGQSPVAPDANEVPRTISALSSLSESVKHSDSAPIRSHTIDAFQSVGPSERPAPVRSSTSETSRPSVAKDNQTDDQRSIVGKKEMIPAPRSTKVQQNLPSSNNAQPPGDQAPSNSLAFATSSEKPSLVEISRPLSDGLPTSLNISRPAKEGGHNGENKVQKQIQQEHSISQQNDRHSDPPRTRPVVPHGGPYAPGPPRYRAISPEHASHDPRRPGIDPMSRALSPDHDRRPRPPMSGPMDRGPPRARPPASRPSDRPMSAEEYQQRARAGRPGPGMRPMSPDDMRPRARPPRPGPTSRPMSPDDPAHMSRTRRPEVNGRPMSPDHGPGRMRPLNAVPRTGGPIDRADRRYEQRGVRRATDLETYEDSQHIANREPEREHAAVAYVGAQRAMSPVATSIVPTRQSTTSELSVEGKQSTASIRETATDARKQYMELVQRSVTLHERYDALRTERQRLATAMSTLLRGSQATQELIDSLANQHLALNTVNSSIDICLAKLKAIDCRKEEVVSRLVLSASVSTLGNTQDAQRPSSMPVGSDGSNTQDQKAKVTETANKSARSSADAVEAVIDGNSSSANRDSSSKNSIVHSNLTASEINQSAASKNMVQSPTKLSKSEVAEHDTQRVSDPAVISKSSVGNTVTPKSIARANQDKGKDEKSSQGYVDHDIFDSYYDE